MFNESKLNVSLGTIWFALNTSSGDSGRTTFVFVILGTFFSAYLFFPDSFILLNSIIHIHLELLQDFQNVIDHEYSLLVFASSFFITTRRKKKKKN